MTKIANVVDHGIALLIVAFFVPSHPELVPGLHVGGGTGTMRMER